MNKLALGVAAASLLCCASSLVASADAAFLKSTGHVGVYQTGDGCVWIVLDTVPDHYFTVATKRQNYNGMRDQLLTAYRSEAEAQRRNNGSHGDLLTIEHDGIPDDGCYDSGGSFIIDLSMVPK